MPHLWLDLEETLINNWDEGQSIYLADKVVRWFKRRNHVIKTINIFSFAIYDDKDKNDFEIRLKDDIEDLFDWDISQYPSVEEIRATVFKYENIQYDSQHEFIQLNGKHWAFVKFCLMQPAGTYYLIDDTVPTLEIIDKTKNIKICLLNVNRDI